MRSQFVFGGRGRGPRERVKRVPVVPEGERGPGARRGRGVPPGARADAREAVSDAAAYDTTAELKIAVCARVGLIKDEIQHID